MGVHCVAVVGPVFPAAGYLLGSIGSGLLLARREGVDLRGVGSGNIGATNVGRVLGKQAYYTVLLLDALKGFAPTLAARLTMGPEDPWTAATGVAAALGHCYPVWHGFRGGKGAATAAGVLAAAAPAAGTAAAVTFVGLKKASRRASVGSLGGAVVGTVATVALTGLGWRTAMASALLALIVARHRSNIARLLRGEEPPS
ncbi:MAG: glycerol-3-phosphate acyltransferase [Myxococcota bacterium]